MGMKISSELIDKYLNDTCTPREREIVHEWYSSFENETEPLSYLSEAQQQELNQRMISQIDRNISLQEGYNRKRPAYIRYSAIGMAATLLIVLGLFFFRSPQPDAQKKTGMPAATALVVVHNSSSILKRQLMPDGTVIWLKPNSRITYAENFSVHKFRQVSLSGEAFFDVKRDTLRPFVIKTGNINTQVLGTSFNIKAYANSDKAEVSVITGKVLVYLDKSSHKKGKTALYLLPNQKAVYSKTTTELQKEKDFTLKIWEKDNFSFNDTPIPEVVRILEKHFSIKIQITDPEIDKYTLKADFNHQNLPNILELLSKSMDVSYQISGSQIQISKNEQE